MAWAKGDVPRVTNKRAFKRLADGAPQVPAKGYATEKEMGEGAKAGDYQFLPWNIPSRDGVIEESDIEYGKLGDKPLLLDLFWPESLDKTTPGLVFIHGGGWGGRDPEGYPPLGDGHGRKGLRHGVHRIPAVSGVNVSGCCRGFEMRGALVACQRVAVPRRPGPISRNWSFRRRSSGLDGGVYVRVKRIGGHGRQRGGEQRGPGRGKPIWPDRYDECFADGGVGAHLSP
jgi:hypothetical protein